MPDTYPIPLPLPCRLCGGIWEHLSNSCFVPADTGAEVDAQTTKPPAGMAFVESAVDEVEQVYQWARVQVRNESSDYYFRNWRPAWESYWAGWGPKPDGPEPER